MTVFCAGWPCVTVVGVSRSRKWFGCKCGDFHARCDTVTVADEHCSCIRVAI